MLTIECLIPAAIHKMSSRQEVLETPPPPAGQRIRYGPGEYHFADLRLPATAVPHPVVIVIHGGFWRAAFDLLYMGHACAALTHAGFATWNIEYRRMGHVGGGYPGTLDDVAAASAHLEQVESLDLTRAVAIGHSAGSHLALWLATSKRGIPLRGAVSLGGVADLRRAWELGLSNTVVADFLGGSPTEHPERYRHASPIQNLPCGVPTRLIHGESDETVPIEIGERFEAAALHAGDDCRLIRLPGAGHFEVVDPGSQEWPEIERTVRELLS
jgi:acetyl esterase/lipase